MAINDVKIKLPLKVTNSLATATLTVQHNGTNCLIDNSIGKTQFGPGTGSYHIVIDHASTSGRLGVGTAPSYGIHRLATGVNATLGVERASGALVRIAATSTTGDIGTVGSHQFSVATANAARIIVSAIGDVSIPAAYTTVIGTPNVDLYIDSTGLIGPNPSSRRYKENIKDTVKEDTEWVYRVAVRNYDMKSERGGEKNKIGAIAEEVEMINPRVVRYGVHEVTETGPVLLNASGYDLTATISELAPGIEKDGVPVYRRSMDAESNVILIREWKKLVLLPISVNLTDFIMPMLKEIQNLNARLENIEKKRG